jgi:hypothetical protein
MANLHQRDRNEIWPAILQVFALAIFSGILSDCGGAMTSANGGPPPVVPSAMITLCDDGVSGCPAATTFNVGSTRDVLIKVTWERLSQGSHVQTLEIMMPGGGLYQSTQAAVFTDAPVSGTFQTTWVLPVAGTWIQQRNISGDWMIRVSLDGQVINSQMAQINP